MSKNDCRNRWSSSLVLKMTKRPSLCYPPQFWIRSAAASRFSLAWKAERCLWMWEVNILIGMQLALGPSLRMGRKYPEGHVVFQPPIANSVLLLASKHHGPVVQNGFCALTHTITYYFPEPLWRYEAVHETTVANPSSQPLQLRPWHPTVHLAIAQLCRWAWLVWITLFPVQIARGVPRCWGQTNARPQRTSCFSPMVPMFKRDPVFASYGSYPVDFKCSMFQVQLYIYIYCTINWIVHSILLRFRMSVSFIHVSIVKMWMPTSL